MFLALVPQLGSCCQHLAQTRQEHGIQLGAPGLSVVGQPGAALPGPGSEGLTSWGRREQQSFG